MAGRAQPPAEQVPMTPTIRPWGSLAMYSIVHQRCDGIVDPGPTGIDPGPIDRARRRFPLFDGGTHGGLLASGRDGTEEPAVRPQHFACDVAHPGTAEQDQ